MQLKLTLDKHHAVHQVYAIHDPGSRDVTLYERMELNLTTGVSVQSEGAVSSSKERSMKMKCNMPGKSTE